MRHRSDLNSAIQKNTPPHWCPMATTEGFCLVNNLEVNVTDLKSDFDKLNKFKNSAYMSDWFGEKSAIQNAINLIEEIIENCANPEND